MDNPPHRSAHSSTNSNSDNPESPLQGSVMFSDSQGFTVNGGTFTNITHHHAASVPPGGSPVGTRMIPLEDIDLQHEIRVDGDTGVVEWAAFRRVYSARVEGRKSKFTVAIYQGNGAKEEWRQQLTKYMSLRHPNIVQIYGTASSGGIHATLFHDDLVPFQQYVDTYRYSHFATVYFYACCRVDFCAADNYVISTLQRTLVTWDSTAWIRRSSGQLCAELIPPSTPQPNLSFHYKPTGILRSHRISSISDTELIVVESLTTEEYHDICFLYLSQFRTISISTSMTVDRGALISCSPGLPLEDPVEIAYMRGVCAYVFGWWTPEGAEGPEGVFMEDGWTRFKSDDVFNGMIELRIWYPTIWGPWLSQANNIFRRLQITSNFGEYVLVRDVVFKLEISGTTEEPPAGFLFLCPQKDFKTGQYSYRWPDSPAYWSLNPSGVDRLTLEEATRLGFPTFQCTAEVVGHSWDTSVYEGLRKFHQAKGFDPDTQDLVRDMHYPLCRLVSKENGAEDWDPDNELDYTQTSIDSDVEASEQDDWDVDNEPNYPQTSDDSDAEVYLKEDDKNSGSTDFGSRRAPRNSNSVSHDHNALTAYESTTGQGECEVSTLHNENPTVSGTFTFLMNAHLTLILFLGLSWLYE